MRSSHDRFVPSSSRAAPSPVGGADRRRLLARGAAAAAGAFFGTGGAGRAIASVAELEAAIARFGGDAGAETDGALVLEMPPIAENGFSVAVTLALESPMSAEDHVEAFLLLAPENPETEIATFHFTPASGIARVSTRIRLARTQRVVALARTSAGRRHRAERLVEVTIGGCGA